MSNLIVSRPWTRRPSGVPRGAPPATGGELFVALNASPVDVASNGAFASFLGSPTVGYVQSLIGPVSSFSGLDRAVVSSKTVTLPDSITLFAVVIPKATWAGACDRESCIIGFTYANLGNPAIRGGSACISLHAFLESFGAKVCAASITYSDATTEEVFLTGGATSNRDPWFVAASYADNYGLLLYAKNLLTNAELSSFTSRSKSLNRVNQPACIMSAAPNLTTSWAACNTFGSFAFAGWVPGAWSEARMRAVGRNPWQLFAPQQIIIPYAAAGYTHPTLSNARMTSLTSGGGVPNVDYTF